MVLLIDAALTSMVLFRFPHKSRKPAIIQHIILDNSVGTYFEVTVQSYLSFNDFICCKQDARIIVAALESILKFSALFSSVFAIATSKTRLLQSVSILFQTSFFEQTF